MTILHDAIPDVLVATMYMLSGLDKFFKLEKAAGGLSKRTFGDSLPLGFYVATIVVSSAMLVISSGTIAVTAIARKHRRWGGYAAVYLVFFTVLATLVYHWPPAGAAYYPFISNVTSVGGLLLLARCRLAE